MTGPRAVNRGMDALLELALAEGGLTLAELTERLELPKSSLLNLLRSFVAGGHVMNRDGRYILGPELYRLAARVGRRRAFPVSLRPVLERLAQETSETAILGVLCEDGLAIELVDVVESARSLRYMARVGHRVGAHASSIGEAIFAFAGGDMARRFLETADFKAYTVHTPRREQFRDRLAEVRRTGIARNIRGQDLELYGISAPVFDAQGRVACAACVGGPISRLDGSEPEMSRLLLRAADEMSAMLGLATPYESARHAAAEASII